MEEEAEEEEEGGAGRAGGEERPATQKPPISRERRQRQFDNTIKPRETAVDRSRTILFTVETQEELRRGFYPSIGGALG